MVGIAKKINFIVFVFVSYFTINFLQASDNPMRIKIKFSGVGKSKSYTKSYIVRSNGCCESASSCSGSGSCVSNSGSCASNISKNIWQPHAFSNYALQDLIILQGLNYSAGYKDWVNRFGVATEYMQSFSSSCKGLGAMPFWSGTNAMTIGNNSGKANLDAFQFGLGDVVVNEDTGIAGTITYSPGVQHVGSEFLWYLMQNQNKPGFYAKVKAPLGAMMISNCLHETPIELQNEVESSTYPYEPYRYQSVTQAFYGGHFHQTPLFTFGRINCEKTTIIRFGDLSVVIGVNFVARESGHIGVGFAVSCPTGNVPRAVYMLEPIFGRAGHWGVGGEMFGHYTHELKNGSWSFWMQADIMHLFSGRQPSFRSFDLKANGKGSKYMLLQQYAYALNAESELYLQPRAIYPAINITTLPVQSTFAVEGNIAMLFDYTRKNWNISLGGEFWGRSGECLKVRNCNSSQYRDQEILDYNLNHYAVIGRQVNDAYSTALPFYCEPLATINKSQNKYIGNTPPSGIEDASLEKNRIPEDYTQALDIAGAAAGRIFTGKIMAEFGYTWVDNCHLPRMALISGIEFTDKDDNHWQNLWSIGLQASLQF